MQLVTAKYRHCYSLHSDYLFLRNVKDKLLYKITFY